MKSSIPVVQAADLIDQMGHAAKARFATDAAWADASGLPRETLCRLKRQRSCDLRTLAALAGSAGLSLVAVPLAAVGRGEHVPERLDREYENELLDLAASSDTDLAHWRARGPAFFMGGFAVMLASARGFDRERYLRLAEALHPGITTPEVFAVWLSRSPLRAARFLPMVRRRQGLS
jgi:hypothetical protein